MDDDMRPAGDRALIAIDWGTTNRRAFLLDRGGRVLDRTDGAGVLALSPDDYPREIAALRARFGAAPIVAAGMVGSTRGWREAPYLDAPASLDDLAAAAVRIAPDLVLVPGVARRTGRPDVMRGEEVQALGAVAAGLVPPGALVCQPGTHNKWITLEDGCIVDLATSMTGELFALVRSHGILAGLLDGPVADGSAFRAGVAEGLATRALAAALFEVRAAVLLGRIDPADAAARASGVLIGSDVGGREDLAGRTVHLLAGPPLSDLYAAAIAAAGGRTVYVDVEAAFTAGARAIWERC